MKTKANENSHFVVAAKRLSWSPVVSLNIMESLEWLHWKLKVIRSCHFSFVLSQYRGVINNFFIEVMQTFTPILG